jgi:large subunit ribosomal protein L18
VNRQKRLQNRRLARARRVRKHVRGTAERPRIHVHRTARHLWMQVIDDAAGKTLCASSSKSLGIARGGNVAAAKEVGSDLGKKAAALGVKQACFDRGPFRYHGRVRAAADAVRAAGIQF